jgi:signal transduction histidine kinase
VVHSKKSVASTSGCSDGEHVEAPQLVRAWAAGGFVRTNAAFRQEVGFDDLELAAHPFIDWLAPDDRECVATTDDRRCHGRHRTRSGGWLPLVIDIAERQPGSIVMARCARAAEVSGLGGTDHDEITVRSTLDTIARIIEAQNPGYRCSILLVADGRFVSGAGPSLPADYNAAVDGHAIGPTVGSCGTAIYWNAPVIVEDIQADPLWRDLAALAATAGVAACWSYPFTSKRGRVLGALALYAPEPRSPTAEQLSRLEAAARLTGLAVERGLAEEALRAQRERELELEAKLRQAAKLEALGVLAGGIAHDFNNLLAIIQGNADYAQAVLPAGAQGITPMLADIIKASDRAAGICQQMLAYAGQSAVAAERVEVGMLLSELSDLMQSALSKKAVLEYVPFNRPIFVEGDENQLLQVVMNLVTNAAEALEDQAGTIVVRADTMRCDEAELRSIAPQLDLPAGDYARLRVSDTGVGMSAETMARIFDPFFTTKFTGRGLGLAAIRGIISDHRGLVQLESTLGEGTTFSVLLPLADAPSGDELVSEAPGLARPSKRVLIVDDEPDLRKILCELLRHADFEVLEAGDGEQAIELFREDPSAVDCVLLDLSMPKRDGREAQQELHALRPDLPIVVMSGVSEREVRRRFEGVSLAGTLKKPIAAAELIATMLAATA